MLLLLLFSKKTTEWSVNYTVAHTQTLDKTLSLTNLQLQLVAKMTRKQKNTQGNGFSGD